MAVLDQRAEVELAVLIKLVLESLEGSLEKTFGRLAALVFNGLAQVRPSVLKSDHIFFHSTSFLLVTNRYFTSVT